MVYGSRLLSRILRFVAVILLKWLLSTAGTAQMVTYNINVSNGLPTNHIYTSLEDHLGYLWLATPRGVIKYNGYESVIFGANKGLPTENIWYLLEDRTGRIWVSSVTSQLGYIYNGVYYGLKPDDISFIFPKNTVPYGKGIVTIANVYHHNNLNPSSMLIIVGEGSKLSKYAVPKAYPHFCIDENNNFVCAGTEAFLKGKLEGSKMTFTSKVYFEDSAQRNSLCMSGFLLSGKIISFPKAKRYYNVLHLSDMSLKAIAVQFISGEEKIIYGYVRSGHITVNSTSAVYLYDSSLNLLENHTLESLTNREKTYDDNPCIFYKYRNWGRTLGTSDQGVYINLPADPSIFRYSQNLNGYRFVGYAGQDSALWWQPKSKTLKIITGGKGHDLHLPEFSEIQVSMPGSEHNNLSWITDKGAFSVSISGMSVICNKIKSAPRNLSLSSRNIIISADSFAELSNQDPRILSIHSNGSKAEVEVGYYNRMIFDRFRYGIWLYRSQKIAFYDLKNKVLRQISSEALERLGIKRIEELCIEGQYGTIVLNDYDKILVVAEDFSSARQLFRNSRAIDAKMILQNGKLIVAGRFGVMSADIKGEGTFSNERWFRNFKDIYFRYIYNICLVETTVLLSTDKGTYGINTDRASGLHFFGWPPGSCIILSTGFRTQCVRNKDTLLLSPEEISLYWDIVNPGGTGKPEIDCFIENFPGWNSDGRQEMTLTRLQPGQQYKVILKARDAIWESDPVVLYIQIIPEWWQTNTFILAVVVCGLLLVLGIIFLTRKTVIHYQTGRRRNIEMNLAGVYAQINPHFIFNSLSTTQYLIRTNKVREASDHIARFSKLLRNFLRASKHKYTSIEQEVLHLKNYFELQQTRLQNSFEYSIVLEQGMDTTTKIPSLLLQPLVENAIEHGLFNKGEKGFVSVSFKTQNKYLIIIVEDNGIGRKAAGEINLRKNRRESYGTGLLRKLVILFNKYEKVKINLEYIDKNEPESGTVIIIKIWNHTYENI